MKRMTNEKESVCVCVSVCVSVRERKKDNERVTKEETRSINEVVEI